MIVNTLFSAFRFDHNHQRRMTTLQPICHPNRIEGQ